MGAQRTTPLVAVIATRLLTHTGVPPHSVYGLAQGGRTALSFESFVPNDLDQTSTAFLHPTCPLRSLHVGLASSQVRFAKVLPRNDDE